MAETHLNERLTRALAALDPWRVENAVGPGTPDINYRGGWIESKQLPAWPKREGTVVKVDHYTPQQRSWHMRRAKRGGNIHVAIEVAGEFFLFNGWDAAQHLGVDWTRDDFYQCAVIRSLHFNDAKVRDFFMGLVNA